MNDDQCINCGSILREGYCPVCDSQLVLSHEELYNQDKIFDDELPSPCDDCHGENDLDCQKGCYLYQKYLRKLKKY